MNLEITQLLNDWRNGDKQARSGVLEFIYPYLRELASKRMRGQHWTMSATEFANEAALELANVSRVQWENREHLKAIAAKVLRRVIVDHQRARMSAKRGGAVAKVDFDVAAKEAIETFSGDDNWIDVDRALTELERIDAMAFNVAELKIFSGMTAEEIATNCSLSLSGMWRQWGFARVWLSDRLASYAHG
jgi:RNA polymerase sigma factor (TIGR02999 family)